MRSPLNFPSLVRRPSGKLAMHPSYSNPFSLSTSSEPTGTIRRPSTKLLIFAAFAVTCALLYLGTPVHPSVLWKRTVKIVPEPPAVVEPEDEVIDLENEQVRLTIILKEAAMDDQTVILTTLNSAWASPDSVLDLFIESFRIGNGTRGLLEHLIMIALDKKAYARCLSLHPHCFSLATEGVDFSGEKDFMSAGYLNMMWRRIDFLREVLEMGYSFIFTDTDIMWFRNPIPHFYPDGDFQIACDHFVGDELDVNNWPNGGFNYVKSNSRTIEFYKFWYSSRENYPGRHDQDVLNSIKHDPFIGEIGLEMRFLNTAYFGGICEPSKDFNKVCTMHANCCIGLSRKVHDLKVMLDDWRKFMSLPPELKKSNLHFWSVPQNCSLVPVHH